MHMRVQGCFIQECFIEIQQVFARKKIRSHTFLTELFIYILCYAVRLVKKLSILYKYYYIFIILLLLLNKNIEEKVINETKKSVKILEASFL